MESRVTLAASVIPALVVGANAVSPPSSPAFGSLLSTSTPARGNTTRRQSEVLIAKLDLEKVGNDLFEKQLYAEAAEAYHKVLRNRPGYAPVRLNYAASFLRQGKWDEAKVQYDQAGNTAGLLNLGLMAMYEGEKEQARKLLDQVLVREPSNAAYHHDKACFHLFYEEWEEGWQEYEWRWLSDQATYRPDPTHEWRGDQSIPSLLLLPEQGYGDSIQFIRYAPLLKPRKSLVCKPAWQSQLGSVAGIDETPNEGIACAFASLMSLPRLTGQVEPFWPGPYVKHKGEAMDFGPGFNVGVCWAGNKNHRHDSWRSAKESDFAPLASVPGVNLVSLQVPGNPLLKSYDDTARAIAGLDLVISVDTSVAHLAGAMGVPTWVLLAKIPDWRYQLKRTDSPWYPSWTLYRQSQLTNWSSVIEQVATDLRSRAQPLA